MAESKRNASRAFSVLILPVRGTRIRRLMISLGALRFVLGLVLMTMSLAGWLVYDYLGMKVERERIEALTFQLTEDLVELRVQSQDQRKKVLSLHERLGEKLDLLAKLNHKRKEAETLGVHLKDKVKSLEAHHDKKVAILKAEIRVQRKKLVALQKRLESSRHLLAELGGMRKKIRASLPPRRKDLLEGDEIVLRLENGIASLQKEMESLIASIPSTWPVEGWISSGFGRRLSPWTGKPDFHAGVDIANRLGAPVLAPGDGVVKFAGRNGSSGKSVVIDHGQGITTHYGHLSRIYVKKGDQVRGEQKIAAVGNTGRSTSPHLHYEVRVNGVPINPRKHLLKSSPSRP